MGTHKRLLWAQTRVGEGCTLSACEEGVKDSGAEKGPGGHFRSKHGERFEDGIRMETLYDLVVDACWVYAGSSWFQWEVPTEEER
jgi:hypothetical protein